MNLRRLYVLASVAEDPATREIIRRLRLPPVVVQTPGELYAGIKKEEDPCAAGKKSLLLMPNKGSFLRRCPGTRDYICCNYNILNFGNYCSMDCAYCILQSYFHPPLLRFFVNQSDLWSELEQLFASKERLRVGTGEFTDSLIWEPVSDLTMELVERFGRQSCSVLELKTKTTGIGRLQNLKHNRRTIVSWSLNTPRVIASYEKGTASLISRLRAAARCEDWGYPLAFHFDPIVLYPGCEEEYQKVIHDLFEYVSAENIAWISMGTFRFMPALQGIVEKRFPGLKLFCGEFVPGLDGKMRYFKPSRIRIYRKMHDAVINRAPCATVYLCMEDEVVWEQSLGYNPSSKGGLPLMLDQSAAAVANLQLPGTQKES